MAVVGLLRIRGASQIVQVCKNGERVLSGTAMKDVAIKEGEGGRELGIVVDQNGVISDIDYDDILDSRYSNWSFNETLSAGGCPIIPGLIDAHTHPVWTGDRVHEFAMKLAGATYMEVHAKGGGIHYTVDCVRKATVEELRDSFTDRLWKMMRCGTTSVEVKSGYGLDTDTELKMIQVMNTVDHPMGLSITYCGAHAIPKGISSEEATQLIIEEQIPALVASQLNVDNIDVFCEKGVFNYEQTKQILSAGKNHGWRINFHGDELHPMKSGELAGELEATAVSHLEEVDDSGIQSMIESGTIGVLLPTTAYILRLKPPPARRMIDRGMSIALGSDFNPNAYCYSMPLVMHLACVNLHMTMNEALVAATINSGASLGISDKVGSIEIGKKADLLILKVHKWEHLIYQLGCHQECISHVIKNGTVVHCND